jgi:hypothetical protein
MRALLSEGMKFTIECADENRGVFRCRVLEIQRGARSERYRAFNLCRLKLWRPARVKRRLSSEACGAYEQCSRSQSEKVAELAPRNLCFFFAVVGEVVLVRRSGQAHITFI